MKKIISLILVLVMVMGLAVSASAASITITPNLPEGGISAGETYTAYKIFDATFEDVQGNAEIEMVSYTIDKENHFYDVIKNSGYFTLTEINKSGVYNVKKNGNFTDTEAALLATQLKDVIDGNDKITGIPGTNNVINVTDKGYYLITSSLGSKMIIDTLGDINIETKNAYPSLEKKIVVGSTEANSVTAEYGDEITFKITVKIPETVNGNIIIHDALDEDMTYVPNSVVGEGASFINECGIDNCQDILHFEVDHTKADDGVVTFTYKATLNGDAATATAHTNVANLTYSAFTSKDTAAVSVYTYEFNVFKYTAGENNAENPLAGAGFVLMNSENKYYSKDENGAVIWVDAITDEIVKTTGSTGIINFDGLANGDYTLIEHVVPAGYNKANDAEVKIDNANKTNNEIKVLNSTGSELPSTGGIGTTLFYVIGGLLMVGAVVLLITKKRMA